MLSLSDVPAALWSELLVVEFVSPVGAPCELEELSTLFDVPTEALLELSPCVVPSFLPDDSLAEEPSP